MRLRTLAASTVATNVVAAAVSIAGRMPAEFGRGALGRLALVGDRDRVTRDFVTWRGTAIAPPLPMVLALAALARAEATPTSRTATGIAAVGAAGTLGHLGEPFTWQALLRRAPRLPRLVVLVSVVLYAGMAVLGTIEARRRA